MIVIVVVFAWNIEPAITTASRAQFAPSDAWVSSLTWLRDNTPEPLGDPNAYYARHKAPPPGESYQYPESVYGVLAWWDYGYWITSIGHRIPNANPSQNPKALASVASFFTAQDAGTAKEIVGELDSSYIIIDYETAHSKFWAVALWAGSEMSEYWGYFWLPTEQGLQQIQLYYPEYYRSMASRLYNFDGQAVSADHPVVVSYQEVTDSEGVSYKQLTSAEEFASYEEAESFLSGHETGNFIIVGTSPYASPVTLEALADYQPVYGSDIHLYVSENMTVPAVKIFEYLE
jgi:dolichyl-diphosphooligosaccharide--protein glycosyltransferase